MASPFAFGTATADHCESNFAVTPLVAEWWNTVSSLVMAAVGVLGLVHTMRVRQLSQRRHAAVLPRHFLLLFIALGFTGAGSAWFHATLSWAGQMADQLPMLWTEAALLYALFHTHRRLHGMHVPAATVPTLLASLLLASYVALTSPTPTPFRATFGVVVVATIAQAVRVARSVRDGAAMRLFKYGMGAFFVGVAVWTAERKLCPSLPRGMFHPHLHSWWHIACSVACHTIFVWLALVHMRHVRKQPDTGIYWQAALLPFLRDKPSPR